MKCITLNLFFLFLSAITFAQKISYNLRMPKPQNHYFEVEMILEQHKEKELELHLPVWTPGSYLVREFSKNINLVKAFDEKNTALEVKKTSKNTWIVKKGNAQKVTVKYEVYSFELSVRTSFLDLSHGFVSGSGVFMYVEGKKNLKGDLFVYPYSGFKTVSTALKKVEGETFAKDEKVMHFTFDSYDQFIDCPLEIGNQEVFHFDADGVDHEVAIYGLGNYDIDALKKDMKKVVNAATNVFGENPNKNYTFIIHNVINGQGGLEHQNSTVLSVNRWTYGPAEYNNFLSLVAHEYFHLWNVKRIRPIELGPFNYDKENYTTLLWVMEGFTSYYDELLMVRSGYYSKEDYLKTLQSTVNYVEGSIGTRIQPVADASFDAWIKAYRPNENSANTTMTYYSRGAMLGAILDAVIIAKFNGKKCLDHFMQTLYTEYYKNKNRGFTEAEFKSTLNTFMGEDMSWYFDKYVFGTETPEFNNYFEKVGIKFNKVSKPTPTFGASFSQENGKTMVKSVQFGGAAEEAGISVGDEIIGCNGMRIDQKSLDRFLNTLNADEYVELVVARDEILLNLQAKMKQIEKLAFKIETISPSNELYYYWLRSLE